MLMDEGYSIVKQMHRYCLHHGSIKSASLMHTTEFDGTPQTSLHITFADGTKSQIFFIGSNSTGGIVSEVR